MHARPETIKAIPFDECVRFWSYVKKTKGEGCWEWQKGKVPAGYGVFYININGESHRRIASRVAYFLTHRKWPVLACHKCDNPKCCRPDHLYDGTHSDNTKDAFAKGRLITVGRRGESNKNAVLTDEIVRAIRAKRAAGITLQAIANEYGITNQLVSLVEKKKALGACKIGYSPRKKRNSEPVFIGRNLERNNFGKNSFDKFRLGCISITSSG